MPPPRRACSTCNCRPRQTSVHAALGTATAPQGSPPWGAPGHARAVMNARQAAGGTASGPATASQQHRPQSCRQPRAAPGPATSRDEPWTRCRRWLRPSRLRRPSRSTSEKGRRRVRDGRAPKSPRCEDSTNKERNRVAPAATVVTLPLEAEQQDADPRQRPEVRDSEPATPASWLLMTRAGRTALTAIQGHGTHRAVHGDARIQFRVQHHVTDGLKSTAPPAVLATSGHAADGTSGEEFDCLQGIGPTSRPACFFV